MSKITSEQETRFRVNAWMEEMGFPVVGWYLLKGCMKVWGQTFEWLRCSGTSWGEEKMSGPWGYPIPTPLGAVPVFLWSTLLWQWSWSLCQGWPISISQRIPTCSAENIFDVTCPTAWLLFFQVNSGEFVGRSEYFHVSGCQTVVKVAPQEGIRYCGQMAANSWRREI